MKKVIGILLVVMMFWLVACSSDGNEVKQPSSESASSTTVGSPANDSGMSESTKVFIESINVDNAEAKGLCGLDLTWYYKDNVLVIKGTGEMNDYKPNTYDTEAPWKVVANDIHLIVVDTGVTSIGEGAFIGMDQLNRIILPDTILSIGNYAAAYCRKLARVEMQNGVTHIGFRAFGWTNIREIDLPNTLTNTESLFFDTPLTEITFPAISSILSNHEFLGDVSNISTVTIVGDMPELDIYGASEFMGLPVGTTINYNGSGFERAIATWPGYNWVKK